MPGKHDVYVYKFDGSYWVQPPVVSVSRESEGLKVRNLTNDNVVLRFPDDVLSKGPEVSIEPKGGDTFPIGQNANGLYEYEVLVRPYNVLARGASSPKIIIDD
jgi:hypothetical protein